MSNPCEKCIVKAMCKKGCDEFMEYLTTNLPDRFSTNRHYIILARMILSGKVELYKGKVGMDIKRTSRHIFMRTTYE